MSLRTAVRYGAPIVIAALLFGAADALRLGTANQLTSLLLLACLAMAWNLVSGFAGQFSLGHSIFVGVGGYGTALALDHLELPLPVVLLGSGVLAAGIGVVLAYPMLRLRGPYFSIGTLGIAVAALGWMLNWDLTRASRGYPISPSDLVDIPSLFRIAVLLALVTLVATIAVRRSGLGLRLLAVRDDEGGAESLGVRRVRTLIPVWALSAFLTGAMGAVVALQSGTLTPNAAFSIQFTLDAVVVCVIGGFGTLSGPLVGAIVVFVLRQYTADFAGWATLVEAVVVILVVRFFPDGIVGLAVRGGGVLRRAATRRGRRGFS